MYNIMTCSGFSESVTGYIASGGCVKARIGLIILFFIIAIARKWGGEEVGINFSFFLALAGGLGSYILLVTILGSYKIALVVGIVLSLIFGYGAGLFGLGEEGGYE